MFPTTLIRRRGAWRKVYVDDPFLNHAAWLIEFADAHVTTPRNEQFQRQPLGVGAAHRFARTVRLVGGAHPLLIFDDTNPMSVMHGRQVMKKG